jgi:hypothetical protein
VFQFDEVQQLQPVKTAALQPDVQNDQAGRAGFDGCQSAVTVCGDTSVIALIFQKTRNQFANVCFIVNN